MIKRILGLVLCLTMILSTATIGLSAVSYKPTVGTPSADADYTGFTSISTESALRSLTTGNKYVLTSDIALESTAQITLPAGITLDGNGHKITCASQVSEHSLFLFGAGVINSNDGVGGVAKITIRNIAFGTGAAPMTLSGDIGLFDDVVSQTYNYKNDEGVSKTTSYQENHVVWENVSFNIKNGSAGSSALIKDVQSTQEFYGCSLYLDITSTTGYFGGWVGSPSGQITFSGCTTDGTVTANARCSAWVGQRYSYSISFIDCVNFADVTGTQAVGGFLGNTGSGGECVTFTNCRNFGKIVATTTGYHGMAGGFVGRMTNPASGGRLNAFYGCVNYGEVVSASSAGGFIGRNHDYDYDGVAPYVNYTFRDCLNVGKIDGADYAGGFMGVVSPFVEFIDFDNCANIGQINASTTSGYAGNLAGMLNNASVTGCYAAGVLNAKTTGTWAAQEGVSNYSAQSYNGDVFTTGAPVLSGTTGTYKSVADLTGMSGDALNAKLAEMKEIFGMSFVKADAADSAESLVVIADPQLRGYQIGANGTQGKVDIRFSAVLNALEAYDTIGFRVSAWANGTEITEFNRTGTVVYKSIRAVEGNSGVKEITAEELSAKYIFSFTLKNVPTDRDITLQVTPYAKMGEVEYSAGTRTVTCHDGTFTQEPMILNGVSLEQFAVVYPDDGATTAKNVSVEHMLAQRLANKIATITGQTVACYAAGSAKNANEIWVKAPVNNGERTISVAENNVISLQAGTDTALSEVVQYFIDQLTEKKQSGQSVWNIADNISVPVDEELSIMAYNLGAQTADNDSTKCAEWQLVSNYLPDIVTHQEPWAGFLDEYLNDYAVQPTTKFKVDDEDDDVMSTDVNNKAMVGNGYYGVYWGMPRWVPGDDNTAGKASYSVILYAKDRFTVDTEKSGTFWLSENWDVSGSAYGASQFARCATYATMTDKNTGETFVVVNVHLDFDDAVQIATVRILLEQMKARVGADTPIFITGDMNANKDDQAIKDYQQNTIMPMTAVDKVAYHSYRDNDNIDWIFTNKPESVEALYYKNCSERTYYNKAWTVTDTTLGKVSGLTTPSDHPAVYAELILDTGNTTGEADRKNRVDLDTVEVELAQGVFTYDGEAKTPDVIFKGTSLTKDTDYTLSYQNNVNAGTATVTITAKDGGRCDGGPRTLNFTINKVTLTESSVSYDAYAGSEPAVTVVVNGKTLVEGDDYEAEYNAETKVITVTGKGNYAGTVEVTVKLISVDESNLGNGAPTPGEDTSTDFGPVQWF